MDEISVTEKVRTAEEWKAFVEGQAASGKTIIEYCREDGIKAHRFYYWRTRWFGERPAKESGSFVECRLTGPRTSALILECRGGYRIQIGKDCDPHMLEQILRVLARC